LFFDFTGLDPELSQQINKELFKKYKQAKRIEEADIILAHVTPLKITKDFNCKYVLCPCTNTNHITIENGAKLLNLSNHKEELKNILATAHHAIYLILNIIWQESFKPSMFMRFIRPVRPRRSLVGMRIGIIGFGRIGRNVRRIAHELGMLIDQVDKDFESCTRHELLTQCDVILISASIEKDQKPIIGEEEFKLMKDGAFLVNISRGSAIDEKALIKHISRLGGFAADVLTGEPDPQYYETLRKFDNVIITPHIGGFCRKDMEDTFKMCYKDLKEFLGGNHV